MSQDVEQIEKLPKQKRRIVEKSAKNRKRIVCDEHNEDGIDVAENFSIFVSMTESLLPEIKNRIKEIKNVGYVGTETSKCIICARGKNTMVLLPCRHQLTCQQCWFIWAEGPLKPKCPKCKKIVKEPINVIT